MGQNATDSVDLVIFGEIVWNWLNWVELGGVGVLLFKMGVARHRPNPTFNRYCMNLTHI